MSHIITFTVQTTVHNSGFLRNNKVITSLKMLTPLSALKSPAWEHPPVLSCSSGRSRKDTERRKMLVIVLDKTSPLPLPLLELRDGFKEDLKFVGGPPGDRGGFGGLYKLLVIT